MVDDGEAVGRELAIRWPAVASESRIEAIASGRAGPGVRIHHQHRAAIGRYAEEGN
jgi:hypothetical protein